MFKLIAFIVLSAALIYLSRASLRAPRSHGFYRFFAAEFTVALVVPSKNSVHVGISVITWKGRAPN